MTTPRSGLKTQIGLNLILEKVIEQDKSNSTLSKVSQAVETDAGRFGTLLQADTVRECS